MRHLVLCVLLAMPVAALSATPQAVTLDVQNMSCATCPIVVKKSLERVTGVTAVKVDFDKKSAVVTYDPDKASPEALTRATQNAGFASTLRK